MGMGGNGGERERGGEQNVPRHEDKDAEELIHKASAVEGHFLLGLRGFVVGRFG